MIKYLCVALDHAVNAYGNIITVRHPNEAIRGFMDEMQKNPHAKDYDLWQLATFNDETGEIKTDKNLLIMGRNATIQE